MAADLAMLAEKGTQARLSHAKGASKPRAAAVHYPPEMGSMKRRLEGHIRDLKASVGEGECAGLTEDTWESIVGQLGAELVQKPVCESYGTQMCYRTTGCKLRDTYDALYKEVHNEFDETIHADLENQLANTDHPACCQILKDGEDYSTEWPSTFAPMLEVLGDTLKITHESTQQMLAIWQNYEAIRLYDIKALLEGKVKSPSTIHAFLQEVSDRCEELDDFMHTHWYPEILEIFNSNEDEHEHGEGSPNTAGLFPTVNALMRIHVQSMLDNSIQAVADSFGTDLPGETPVFSVELTVCEDGSKAVCVPSLEDLAGKMDEVLQKLTETLQTFTPIDAWLAGSMSRLENHAHGAALERNRKFVHKSLADRMKSPHEELAKFDQFAPLLPGGEMQVFVDKFSQEGAVFLEVVEQIERFQGLADEIEAMESYTICNTIHVNVQPLIEHMAERAKACVAKLTARLAVLSTEFNIAVCKGYETIRKKALKDPEDSLELMSLITYMENVKSVELEDLRAKTKVAQEQINMTMQLHTFTEEEIDTNFSTLAWWQEISASVDDSEIMIGKAKTRGEDTLHSKREKLIADIEKTRSRIKELEDASDMEAMQQYLREVGNIQKALQGLTNTVAGINREEELFGWDKTSYPDIVDLNDQCAPFAYLFQHTLNWQKLEQKTLHGAFEILDGDKIKEQVDEMWRDTFKTAKQYSASTNMYKICDKIKKQITTFKEHLPVVQILCNPGLRERHWIKMSEVMGQNIQPDSSTTLAKVLELDIKDKLEAFETISGAASKEFSLEKAMDKMQEEWKPMEFNVSERDALYILAGCDDIEAILDDHIVKTQTMMGSPFIKPFKERITVWEKTLKDMADIIEGWLKMQASWMYLEPIFSSPDIMAQMPEEGRLFTGVDGDFKMMMAHLRDDPNCLITCAMPDMLNIIIKSNENLELILKGLNEYLEKKRLYFARFFFLSNDEMLSILSETKDPTRVQPHLKKCFEGIKSLTFTPELDITEMISSEKELITLTEVISTAEARGSVEKWLLILERVMKESVKLMTKQGFDTYVEMPRVDWICVQPGQVALSVGQCYWTTGVHGAIRNGAAGIKEYWETLKSDLRDIVDLVRGKVAKLVRKTCEAMITLDVHARDVTEELAELGVKTENDFNWLQQFRYYWMGEEGGDMNMYAKIINSTCNYEYEYLGNSFRLVVTPLTDRCYRTLIGAYALNLGGAPEGPAGTGKTETTKDLAKAIGIQCVVFNCSDGLDFRAMGKFFKGLAAAGAWACFDEFNRIEIEVLSVIAQQLQTIFRAVKEDAKQFLFEGTLLNLKKTCCSFITMNPGYAGRSELPDNLKVLFRTVAMMVPNYAMIAEIQLYSSGYINARACGYKITTTYKLCSEQLSSQFHYDYGMRAVKAVLRAAANLKLKFPDSKEELLVLRAIVDVNVPKFLSHDIPLFNGIISDLFPGMTLPDPDYVEFIEAATEICRRRDLQLTETFLKKLIETYEMLLVRHGFMLVGEPFSGKTEILKVLAEMLTLLCEKHEEIGDNIIDGDPQFRKSDYSIINPKAITMGQLFGQFDPISHEWTDGIVPNEFRRMAQDPGPDRHWVWFDGPVDTLWIESMNTVLDDNKKLCLMSGEIIAMSDHMSMIFENMDLSQASPATVSRCGMIYLEPRQLGWRPLATSWIAGLPEYMNANIRKTLDEMFETFIDPMIKFLRKQCIFLMPMDTAFMATSLMRMISMTTTGFAEESNAKVLDQWLQGCFMFSFIWSLGATVNGAGRELFSDFFKEVLKGTSEAIPHEFKFASPIPDEGSVYDYVFVAQGKGKWLKWLATVNTELVIKPGQKIKDVLVPTMDTARYTYLMDLAIKNRVPTLFVGPTGTGKSVYVRDKLMSLPKAEYNPEFLTFSAQTSAQVTQNFVMSKLDKRRRGVFGPPPGKTCVFFVDDLNMPLIEQYGAQPPLELLRTLLDHGFWSDLVDTTRMTLQDVLIIGAMGPPGGGRNQITSRLSRHMHIIGMTDFNNDTRSRIFTAVIQRAFRDLGYPMELQSIGKSIVDATVSIFNESVLFLLPTPAKSHYTFNLRDLSRVVNGVLMMPGSKATDKTKVVRLWAHEVYRVFYDRLIDDTDRKWLFKQVQSSTKEFFKMSFSSVFARLQPMEGQAIGMEHMDNLMFGTYVHPTDNQRPYDEAEDIEEFRTTAKESLDEYNQINKTPMDLVVFTYVLQHLSKVCRVLKQDGGHAMLIGVGGSGRQSVVRLASQIMDYDLFQPEISKSYGTPEWKEDVKFVLKKAGAEDRPTVLLLNDTQIKKEEWLEDIDSLLNSGEVNNIFAIDERVNILESCREPANRAAGGEIELSPLEIFTYFIGRCKDNLHICLGMSPIGTVLQTRLRMFPSLVNCCTIDWFQAWPQEALQVVAESLVEDVELTDVEEKAVVHLCQFFQSSVADLALKFRINLARITYVTPTSYLELFKSFKALLQKKRDQIMSSKNQYETGLKQIAFAETQVASMQEELIALQPKLVVAQAENKVMTAQIEKETIEANKVEEHVAVDEADAKEKAGLAKHEKEECEALLAEAVPALNAALKALDTLKPSDIGEVKAMKSPPAPVKLVMEAVCIMKGVKSEKIQDPDGSGKKIVDYWGPAKKMLGDMKFLQSLKDYDKDNMDPKTIKTIRDKYVTNPGFVPAIIAKASRAAEGLCSWVRAMEVYDRVAKVVAPKKIALAQKMKEVEDLMATLKKKQDELKAIQDKLQALNDNLALKTKEKQELEDKVILCEEKLVRAKKLISGLGGEKSRWQEAAERLGADYNNCTGDVLLSSGVIAYLGPFTTVYRSECIALWVKEFKKMNLACTEGYKLSSVVGDPVKIRQWHIDGLPTDGLSVDNGTIIANARRWPLMIDPQGQANKWVKAMEKPNKLSVTKLTDATFMRTLENAIQFGHPVLIENVLEDLDPSLEGLLLRNTFKQAGVVCIKLGDNTIEYSDDFRFYVTTKLPNPHYLPEVATKVTLLNFMITLEGLEDQLLGIVVAKERPEVEEERQQLILASAANQKKLKEVEVRILETLTKAGAKILEDAGAIVVLDDAKVISDEVSAKQKIAEKTTIKINDLRKGYQPVAGHSSVLFFVIAALADVDPMYQYSLEWFVALYVQSIQDSNKSQILTKRLRFLSDHFTYALYTNVCRSLFEKHKLLFSFLLCCDLMKSRKTLEQSELMFFLTGGVGVDNSHENPDTTWVPKPTWDQLCRLSEIKAFSGIREHFAANTKDWKAMYDAKMPQNFDEVPEEWKAKLSNFQKLLLLRCVRADKVVHAARDFVEENLGQRFTAPPPFDLGTVFEDSSAVMPLIFVLSPGADPMTALLKFGNDNGFSGDKFSAISLGQGQGPIAERMIEKSRVEGGWVVLQNCHLATSWMNSMEKVCEGLKPGTVHDDFRLWLTSYPTDSFPVSVLQNGVKMTNEPPDGIRMNMMQSYLNDPIGDPEWFNKFTEQEEPDKQKRFEKMLFGMCFFHAIVQERRSFGAQGWNIPYGFNESDLRISIRQLQIFIDEYDDVQYEALQYLTGQCNYGGRVTDDWDRRCLMATLMNAYDTPVVEETKYKFSSEPNYFVPQPDGHQSFIDFITELPVVQSPSLFGMHENVDISKETLQTNLLFDAMIVTQSKAGSGDAGGGDMIDMVAGGILEGLPDNFDTEKCLEKYPIVYEESMNTVLVQEMQRFNRVLTVMRKTLINLRKALKGLVVMNADLDNVGANLALGRVPASWAKASYPSLKPLGSYVKDLYKRLDFFHNWYENGKPGCFWLPGFYFNQAFLTGALQNYARKYTVPIDIVTFDFEVLRDEPPHDVSCPSASAGQYYSYCIFQSCL